MKNFLFISLIMLFTACNFKLNFDDDDFDDCDYSNCSTIEPFFYPVNVKFSRTDNQPNPRIYLVKGFYDKGQVIDTFRTDTINGTILTVVLPVNSQFTFYTKYTKGPDTIIAIDGNYIKKTSYYECDSLCWTVKNTFFNIKLK